MSDSDLPPTTISATAPSVTYSLEQATTSGWNQTTTSNGATAMVTSGSEEISVAITFTGTSLSADGHYSHANSVTYTLDSHNRLTEDIAWQVSPFFTLTGMTCMQHTVTLFRLQDDDGKSQLEIQDFQVQGCDPTSSSSIGISSTSGSTASVSTSSQTSTSTSLPSTDAAVSHTNAGTIAGAAVGSLVGLTVILALAFFLWRRRRRQKQLSRPSVDYLLNAPGHPPFAHPFAPNDNLNHTAGAGSSVIEKPPIIPAARQELRTIGHIRIGSGGDRESGFSVGLLPNSAGTSNFELTQARPMPVDYLRGYLPDSKDWIKRQEDKEDKAREAHEGGSSGDRPVPEGIEVMKGYLPDSKEYLRRVEEERVRESERERSATATATAQAQAPKVPSSMRYTSRGNKYEDIERWRSGQYR